MTIHICEHFFPSGVNCFNKTALRSSKAFPCPGAKEGPKRGCPRDINLLLPGNLTSHHMSRLKFKGKSGRSEISYKLPSMYNPHSLDLHQTEEEWAFWTTDDNQAPLMTNGADSPDQEASAAIAENDNSSATAEPPAR